MPAALCAFLGTLLPIVSYVWIGSGKYVVRGSVCVGRRGSTGTISKSIRAYFSTNLLEILLGACLLSYLKLLSILFIYCLVTDLIYLLRIPTKLIQVAWNLILWTWLAAYSVQSHMFSMINNPGHQDGKTKAFSAVCMVPYHTLLGNLLQ